MRNLYAINSKGGMYSLATLLKCAHAVYRGGSPGLMLSDRQQLLFQVPADEAESLDKLGSICVRRDSQQLPNVVCSHYAGGLEELYDWAYTKDVYQELLESLDFEPRLAVNFASFQQKLMAVFSGEINFVASEIEHFWHVSMNLNGTRALASFVIPDGKVIEILKFVDDTLAKEPYRTSGWLFSAIQQKWHEALKYGIDLKVSTRAKEDCEGFHAMANGRLALNLFNNHDVWDWRFIEDMCQLAKTQGLGRIYATSGRSLLIKHIEPRFRQVWQHLLGKHGITLRHSEQELAWIVQPQERVDVRLKEKLIQSLSAEKHSFAGLRLAINPKSRDCGADILIYSAKTFLATTYDIYVRQDFDYRLVAINTVRKRLTLKELVHQLRAQLYRFHASFPVEEALILPAVNPSCGQEGGQAHWQSYQCPNCLSEYDESLGDPIREIAPETSFESLPATWCCHVCEADKSLFSHLVTT